MSDSQIGQFDNGAIRRLSPPWRWLEVGSGRVPVELTRLPDGPIQFTGAEYARVLGGGELHRMLVTQIAGHAALAVAYGVVPVELRFEELTTEAESKRPLATYVLPPDAVLPVSAATAIGLAGQLAVEVYLRRQWLYDPRRVLVTWSLASSVLNRIPTNQSTKPYAYLYGELASPPAGWTGAAVHIDHLRAWVRTWLEDHWESVEVIAGRLLAETVVDEQVIRSLVVGPGAQAAIEPLPADHPLYDTTAIPLAAMSAAATWWTGQLREQLSRPRALDDGDGLEAAEREPRYQGDPVAPETLDAFHAALLDLIKSHIERRTERHDGGLEWVPEVRAGTAYRLEMHNGAYDAPAVLAEALRAVGLNPLALYMFRGGGVDMLPHGALLRTGGHSSYLWTSPYAAVDEAAPLV